MNVNLKGVFLGCKYGIPALLRACGGSIINTASLVAVMGAATPQVAYTASKGGGSVAHPRACGRVCPSEYAGKCTMSRSRGDAAPC